MFKDNFKKELDVINPSAELETAVLNKICQEKERLASTPKKAHKKGWIAAVAAVLVVVIVLVTAFNLPLFNGSEYILNGDISTSSNSEDLFVDEDLTESNFENQDQQPSQNVPTSITYDAAYKLFDKIAALREAQKNHYNGDNTASKLSDSNEGQSNSTDTPSVNNTPSKNYTETNIQVEGVEEGDIVKTNGEYIYALERSAYADTIYITKATDDKLSKTAHIYYGHTPYDDLYEYNAEFKEFYLCSNTLVIIISAERKSKNFEGDCTIAMLFDVSNPKSPQYIKEYVQTGKYTSSRLIGDNLYLFSQDSLYGYEKIKKPDDNFQGGYTYEYKRFWQFPKIGIDNRVLSDIDEKNLYVFDDEVNLEYFLAVSIDVKNRKRSDSKAIVGGGSNVYVNNNAIYAVSSEINYFEVEKEYIPKTYIMKFGINKGEITPLAKTNVKGSVLNQFLMDEYDGYFRIITTTRKYRRNKCCAFFSVIGIDSNTVYVLDKDLKTVSSIKGIAKGEAVTSSRFMGEIGYFCTSPQDVNVDPFFAVDFSNPKNPKILDSLKFPGVVNYLQPYDDNLMLGIGETESGQNVKLIMFDVSNPKKIKQLFTLNTNVSCEYNSFNGSNGHKKVNVLKDKDIICFSGGTKYNIYKFSKQKGFIPLEKNQFSAKTNEDGEIYSSWDYSIRGVFIDDYLYVCNGTGIVSYMPFKGNKKISEIIFYNYP